MHMDQRTVCLAPQLGPVGGCPGHRTSKGTGSDSSLPLVHLGVSRLRLQIEPHRAPGEAAWRRREHGDTARLLKPERGSRQSAVVLAQAVDSSTLLSLIRIAKYQGHHRMAVHGTR
jgi:hypothetical protein